MLVGLLLGMLAASAPDTGTTGAYRVLVPAAQEHGGPSDEQLNMRLGIALIPHLGLIGHRRNDSVGLVDGYAAVHMASKIRWCSDEGVGHTEHLYRVACMGAATPRRIVVESRFVAPYLDPDSARLIEGTIRVLRQPTFAELTNTRRLAELANGLLELEQMQQALDGSM